VTRAAGPGGCPPWCTTRHGTGLLTGHSGVCVELTTRHGEVTIGLEQCGDWPPVVALSIEAPPVAAPAAAGFAHLSADEARRLCDTLMAAIDLIGG
jgi:hypothetical protein